MNIRNLIFVGIWVFTVSLVNAAKVINVPCTGEDQTQLIQKALVKASFFRGEAVTIKLEPHIYNLYRNKTSFVKYHVSNTTSVQENPDPTKHIGIWMKDLENITIDGNGATLLTHGEITSFVIDNCKNIKISNFRLDAADPSVVEINITKVGDNYIEFEVLPPSDFVVKEGIFYFQGEGWKFGDGKQVSNHDAIAQIYDPALDMTLRKNSPIQGYTKAEKTGDRTVKMFFNYHPGVKPGERYQLRHSIRNEVCMLINDSKDVEIRDVDFNFMGNFGIVSQFTENITFENIHCEPREESGRTNAGFADFLQFSSCKGLIRVLNSRFSGSHDDPINIHGTHLQVVETVSPNKVVVEYRHPQTFGFLPFKKGDDLKFVNRETLNYEGTSAQVDSIIGLDDYKYELILNQELSAITEKEINRSFAVENLTWTPEVEIKGNYFSRTPTRAILIATKGKALIENNKFFHIPMASILVADDANSWYESGPVEDLTIKNNIFIECQSPVILVAPEIRQFNQPVHSNIKIIGNRFLLPKPNVIDIKASTGILIKKNLFEFPYRGAETEDNLIKLENVNDSKIEGNRIIL